MALVKALLFFFFFFCGLVLISAALHEENETPTLPPCKFPAIYNFGDSNSDTGGISAAFFPIPPPNGETFFQKPAGRACDGRLIIDFIAESLGRRYLSAYLDSVGSCFQHGANFAAGGSTIRPQNLSLFEGGIGPFSLNVQVVQFSQFKARTTEIYRRGKGRMYNLPKPKYFSKALYTLDIGQNDLAVGFRTLSNDQVLAAIPGIINQFYQDVHQLYLLGARTFWIHNTGPIGCLPFSVLFYPYKPHNLDQNGCVKPQNDIAQEFNRQLKDKVTHMRGLFPKAAFIYVDVYSAKYLLISIAKKHEGFMDPLKFCCGHHEEGRYHVNCGEKIIVNGTVHYGGSCDSPSSYVSWDGVHYSHAANQWLANRILNGGYSDPPLPLTHACHGLSR